MCASTKQRNQDGSICCIVIIRGLPLDACFCLYSPKLHKPECYSKLHFLCFTYCRRCYLQNLLAWGGKGKRVFEEHKEQNAYKSIQQFESLIFLFFNFIGTASRSPFKFAADVLMITAYTSCEIGIGFQRPLEFLKQGRQAGFPADTV